MHLVVLICDVSILIFGIRNVYGNGSEDTRMPECSGICADLPTHPYFTILVRKSAGSTDVHQYFSKHGHRISRKYGNHDMNKCEFVPSKANC